MKINFQIWNSFLEGYKVLSIFGVLFLILLTSCEGHHLGLPGNALSQAQQAVESQRKALKQMTSSTKKELIENKDKVKGLLTKAEPFLARRANELEATELLLAQDHIKKAQEALRVYLDARTQPGKDTTTSEMSRALSQASDSLNSAENVLSQYKSKQGESND